MNDKTHDRGRSIPGIEPMTPDADGGRRPYAPPTLQRHAKLPVITAGSISEEAWQFQSSEPN